MGSEARPTADYTGGRLRLEFGLASEANAFAGAVEEAASSFMIAIGGGLCVACLVMDETRYWYNSTLRAKALVSAKRLGTLSQFRVSTPTMFQAFFYYPRTYITTCIALCSVRLTMKFCIIVIKAL